MKIFLIDDNEDFVLLFKQVISKISRNALCMSAENGYQALSNLRFMLPGKPDLIFVDVKMPIMDGYEILKEIKRMPELNTIPVIMYSSVEQEPRAQHENIAKFFLKPNTIEGLHNMLVHALKLKA